MTESLVSSRLLVRNTLWNLVGQVVPMAVSLVTIPFILRGLGLDRYGILSLVWVLVGYFGLFDLGLGRALTKLVADRLGLGRAQDVPGLFWTSQALMLGFGVVGGFLLVAVAAPLARQLLKIPEALVPETLQAFILLALCVPLVTTGAGFQGMLVATQRFDLLTAMGVPLGALTYAAPLLVLPFTSSLFVVVAALLVLRLVGWFVGLLLCYRAMPSLRLRPVFDRGLARRLVGFGGWMTVTNVVGPLMVSMDRFLIGGLLSVTAVAFYATPYSVVSRLLLIPSVLGQVLFPAFASSMVQDRSRTAQLFERGVRYVFLAMFLPVLLIVALGREGLTLWLGAAFAKNGAPTMQVLAVGMLTNGLAFLPFALLQGAGRPDLTAKVHVVELPVYLLAVWGLTVAFGIVGTAVAFTLRATVDAIVLFVLSLRLLPALRRFLIRLVAASAAAVAAVAAAAFLPSLAARSIYTVVTVLAFAILAWRIGFAPDERRFVTNMVVRRTKRP